MSELSLGLHETLITRRLARAIGASQAEVESFADGLDPEDSHVYLARYIYELLSGLLSRLPLSERLTQQTAICNRVVELLQREQSSAVDVSDDAIEEPAQLLLAAVRRHPPRYRPPRPSIPLTQSTLLVNAHGEPAVGAEIRQEIESADRIDLICAFVRWYGVRILLEPLQRFIERGGAFRVITTTYLGATERRALDELHKLGAEVRVNYELASTKLHAKAWLLERNSGLSTAYVGSSNLSKTALVDGLEWNVRLTQTETPDILEKFRATFQGYWESEIFEPYDPTRDAARFDQAVARSDPEVQVSFALLDIRPWPHQERILEDLAAERERHGRTRNLVVAATGTGKTVVAALDYRRLRETLSNPSLLFVAHRREILSQSLATFRAVLRDSSFGELYVDGNRPGEWRHVFASIQSLSAMGIQNLAPSHFDVVIVDEFHHAAAETYDKLLNRISPKYLLGLTATPERSDGRSITKWFDGRFASELRLWQALDEEILSPFHYFGISDGTDLSHLQWKRGGYQLVDLENVYTGNDARVARILSSLSQHGDPGTMRALGFCVSVAHADYMAKRFTDAGIPAAALSANSTSEERDNALRHLQSGQLSIIFAVDLFNEGVDVPEIDTILFLRPTESATIFLQQLGRGLRKAPGKTVVTVLDFIGQQHERFRFDLRYRAITGQTKAGVRRQIEQGFPFLPAGCNVQLDRVATETVLQNIKHALRPQLGELSSDLQSMGNVSLSKFVSEADVDLEDIYRTGVGGWTAIRRAAGIVSEVAGPYESTLIRGLTRMRHVDDPERTKTWVKWLELAAAPNVSREPIRIQRLAAMLHFLLWSRENRETSFTDSMKKFWPDKLVRAELGELLTLLEDRSRIITMPVQNWPDVPLHVHARYTREEVLAALGASTIERPKPFREGVYYDQFNKIDVFFVTLQKTERDFSPSTLYRDYAISQNLFHWESQSTTSLGSPTGKRYLAHDRHGSSIWLFVRDVKIDAAGNTPAFLFLGPAHYVSHAGDKPIAITWRLETAMPPDFFQSARVAAG